MKVNLRHGLAALAIAVVLGVTYVMNFGLYPRFFDIAWDEEVQLHDGRVIVVHVKRTFERVSGFEKWRGIYRDTEIGFDAGGTIGFYVKNFQRHEVSLLEQKADQWFIGLVQTSGTPPIKWVDFNTPFLVLESDGQLRKETLEKFPAEFTNYNLMPVTPNSEGIARFNGQFLTQAEKMKHWTQYPRGAGDDGKLRRRNTLNNGEEK